MIKKGFTLVEIIIVMALVILMLGVVDGIFISYVKTYKSNVSENKGFNYLNDAIFIIEKEVNQNVTQIKTDKNIIKIDYYKKIGKINSKDISKKDIKLVNSNLYILYGGEDIQSESAIIDDVKAFVAIKSGKNIYIKILWYNGQSIERCLVIENAN